MKGWLEREEKEKICVTKREIWRKEDEWNKNGDIL